METKRGSVTSVGNLRQSMDEIASSVEGDVPVIISIVVKTGDGRERSVQTFASEMVYNEVGEYLYIVGTEQLSHLPDLVVDNHR